MKVLVTGGAGFIGSNLIEALLQDKRVSFVRCIDDLSNGYKENIEEFLDHPNFEFLEGDIRDFETCLQACEGIDLISHQAALGSVPRSIRNPIATNDVNINGTLNIYKAAVDHKVKRVVFASSSSVYGDNEDMPKVEKNIGDPLSPYALTKLTTEKYAKVFSKVYDFNFIGLRYFNVFGPKQSPNGAYAAVIPIFMEKGLKNEAPVINGDGSFSRDFTYIANVVRANTQALFTEDKAALNEVYNIAFGGRITLNDLWREIKKITGATVDAIHGPARMGDVPHSLADISKAQEKLKFEPFYPLDKGLSKTIDWYKKYTAQKMEKLTVE